MKKVKEEEQEAAKEKAVFPCVLQILPEHIFNNKDPIIVGVEVLEGVARVGTLVRTPNGLSTIAHAPFIPPPPLNAIRILIRILIRARTRNATSRSFACLPRERSPLAKSPGWKRYVSSSSQQDRPASLAHSLTHSLPSLPSKPQEKGKPLQKAVTGDKVAMKLEATNAAESAVLFGRHFDAQDALVSRVTRDSIDVLKANFRDEMSKDDWRLVIRLKKVFNID